MHWTIAFVLAVFVTKCSGDFVSDANALIANQKTVRLDPILRRALLKALTELEEEAQLKAKEEEDAARSTADAHFEEARSSGILDQAVLDNHSNNEEIQSTADSTYPTVNPVTVQDTVTPNIEVSSTTEGNTVQPEQPTNPPATVQDTFFFQTPSPLENEKSKLQAAPLIDIETNLITDDKELKDNKKAQPAPTQQPQETSQTSAPTKGSENDVDIFKAPLVAAFTLHQDSKGTPHSIIPIFKSQEQSQAPQQSFPIQQQQTFQIQQQQSFPTQQQQNFPTQQQIFQNQLQQAFQIPQLQNYQSQQLAQQIQQQQSLIPQQFQQQQVFIQPSRQAAAFTFNPNQQLQQPQFPAQNQFSVNNFASQQFIPSQGPFGTNQQANINQFSIPSGQQQLPSLQTPSQFQQQQIPSVTITPLSQPHNLNNNNFNFPSSTAFPPVSSNSIVPSQSFQISSTPNPIRDQGFSSTSRPITGFPSSTPNTPFTIPPVTLPLANEARFQSPIIVSQSVDQSRNHNQFLAEQELARQRQVASEQELARQRQAASEQEQARQRQIAEQNRLRQLEEQSRFRQLELLNRQREVEEERLRALAGQGPDQFRAQRQQPSGLAFQRSLGFQYNTNPFQFQPSQPQRVNRQEAFGSTGNFGFNNQEYRTIPEEIYRQRNFRSPQQQLAQLLFQSGVATDASGQEDLNIVSKVLALNHERSDGNIQENQRSAEKAGKSGFSKPINVDGFQPISRSDDAEGSLTEKKAEEKTLLVGEIKDFTGGR